MPRTAVWAGGTDLVRGLVSRIYQRLSRLALDSLVRHNVTHEACHYTSGRRLGERRKHLQESEPGEATAGNRPGQLGPFLPSSLGPTSLSTSIRTRSGRPSDPNDNLALTTSTFGASATDVEDAGGFLSASLSSVPAPAPLASSGRKVMLPHWQRYTAILQIRGM